MKSLRSRVRTGKHMKKALAATAFILIMLIGAKILIEKSDGIAPKYTVLIAKTEIKIGDQITESVIEPMTIPASLVKSQAFYWTPGDSVSNDLELNSIQMQKVIGKKSLKLLNRGDQIIVTGIK